MSLFAYGTLMTPEGLRSALGDRVDALRFRPDEVKPSLPVDDALANAPRRDGSFFQVPRIVPGPGGGSEEA